MTTATFEASQLSRASAEVIRQLVGETPLSVERLRRGVMNIKFVAETADRGDFIIRFYARTDAAPVDHEPDLIRALEIRGAPVARVIGDSRTGPPAPLPYMAYELVPGACLRDVYTSIDPAAQGAIAAQVADFLATLGELSVDGYGDLLTSQRARFRSWHDFMGTSFDVGLHSAMAYGSLSAPVLGDLQTIRGALGKFDSPARSTLAWGDLLMDNIVVGDEPLLAGFVDFEGTLAAEPALNLGYCYAAHDEEAFASDVEDAWSTARGRPDADRVRLYSVLRGVRIAQFAHLPLPTGKQRTAPERLFPGFVSAARTLADRIAGTER